MEYTKNNTKETINIVFSSDDNYAQFMGVTICSIFENKKDDYLIDIYVLDGGILKDNKEKLKILENRYNFKINYIQIDTSFFKDFYISHHLTQATYYRIIIPDLFPNINKMLYLDCDIIVRGDIFELYNINIENYFFAAVDEHIFNKQKELKMPNGAKYFNAGIMLINLYKWREFDINKTIIKYIKEQQSNLESHDQDALNATMFDKWLEIPFKYNYTTFIFKKFPLEYNKLKNDILIIHYTDYFKPWNYFSSYPLNKEYFYYLEKTPWKNIKIINKTLKNILIKHLKNILSKRIVDFIKKVLVKI